MNSEDEATSLLLNSLETLQELIQKKGPGDEDEAIKEYLSSLNNTPIEDFPKNMEWFNVSESISLSKHLKGKIVILDFFTYCCINCMHILPVLKDIENRFSITDGLVVVGVHSAKFENEKISQNILSAIQRYNITHPVINDRDNFIWKLYNISCWPTILVLGPHANPILLLMGESDVANLNLYLSSILLYYKSKNEISPHKLPLKSAFHLLPDLKGPLLFPGKIACCFDNTLNCDILAISDTGNNRILIVKSSDGCLIHEIGGKHVGFLDGNFENVQFRSPQGLTFQNSDVIYVAEPENHAIRKISLVEKRVTTVIGTGENSYDYKGGKIGKVQSIGSPWDVALYKKPDGEEVLFLANAGTHQIWAYFLQDTLWWKNQKYTKETCICIAGSGREENRNNQYPHIASFAQPSGLALCLKNQELYIADSESSTIRKLSLIDGKVSAVVGGDINPNNLFAYGDIDGQKSKAKLQHPLGLVMSKDENSIFVADTYNHKLKKINISNNTISTLKITELSTLSFNEPSGLCLNSKGDVLFVADTNNHCIKTVNIDNSESNVICINNFPLSLDTVDYVPKVVRNNVPIVNLSAVNLNKQGGKLIIKVSLVLSEGLHLNNEAPQKWKIYLPNPSWTSVPNHGTSVLDIDIVINVPSLNKKKQTQAQLDIHVDSGMCSADSCLMKNFVIRQPLLFDEDSRHSAENTGKIKVTESNVFILN